MGWNDRIEKNPYEPYPDYTEQDQYEAWMHYQELCRKDSGISSQNIDPATMAPQSDGLSLSRLFARFLGRPNAQQQKEENENEKEIPF